MKNEGHSLDAKARNSITHSHTLKKYERPMFRVTFLIKWNGAYYTKNVKILISNADGLVP